MSYLNIEIRLVNRDDEDEPTSEIMAPSKADNAEHANKLAAETAESEKAVVRLYVVGGDDHFHEPIEVDDFYPVKHLADKAIESLPEKTHLVYVDYRDQLSDDQVKWLLEGDIDRVTEDMWQWEDESRYYGIKGYWDDCGLERDEKEAVEQSDEYERFREACEERDESTPLQDLINGTPAVMIRYSLDHVVEPGSWMMTKEEQEDEAKGIAEAAGIDYEDNKEALRSLVVEASYGGTLCVLHQTCLSDVYDVIESRKFRDGNAKVVFTDPVLLVYDGLNGSGHMEEVVGTVTVKIDDGTMQHDAGRFSWSDDIAGIVHSSCSTKAEFIITEKEKT